MRHVAVTGNRLVPAAQVRSAAGIRPGSRWRGQHRRGGAPGRADHAVLSATVSRSWPDTIVITVRERTPALAVPRGGGFDLVDEYGVTVRARPGASPPGCRC